MGGAVTAHAVVEDGQSHRLTSGAEWDAPVAIAKMNEFIDLPARNRV
jgi:hypothetical protein